jgi:hypothetical protein
LLLCWPNQAGTRPPLLHASTCRQTQKRKRRDPNRNSSSSSGVLQIYLLAIWAAIRSAASCTVLIFSAPVVADRVTGEQQEVRQ